MLQALGAQLLDAAGGELPRGGAALAELDRIDLTGLHPGVRETRLVVASDVDNPLLGPTAPRRYTGRRRARPRTV